MENLLWGLSYWTYLSFLFLAAAGFCTAKASKFSTKNVVQIEVQEGVKNTLKGTNEQINNPLARLYDYAVKNHLVIVEELIGQQLVYATMLNMEDDSNGFEIEGVEELSNSQIKSMKRNTSSKIANLKNKYNVSFSAIEQLVHDSKNPKVDTLFEEYVRNMDCQLKTLGPKMLKAKEIKKYMNLCVATKQDVKNFKINLSKLIIK